MAFALHTLTFGANGKVIPLRVSGAGHYILSVADFLEVHYFPPLAASSFHWAPKNRETHMMDLAKNGGRRWDDPAHAGLNPVSGNFTPPKLFSAYKAATLRNAGNPDRSGPSTFIMKLHVNWGHASAAQNKRVLVDAEGGTQSLIQHVDDVVAQ